MESETEYFIKIVKKMILPILIPLFVFLLYIEFINPYIHVWQQSMKGRAELARAESNRQIATCEAMAKKESSKALSDAEVIRAEGVAKANKIIGDSLEDNEGYLRYLYITHLTDSSSRTVIYVPTEGTLPILESTRLIQK